MESIIRRNIEEILKTLPKTNRFGEKITLVAATKTRTVEEINEAISAGITDIGENKAQEFRDKFPLVLPCRYHFFGRLQKNKVKYLIGKTCLIQSVDSFDLAEEISSQSEKKKVVTDILLEVNLGEEQKGGVPFQEVVSVYENVKKLPFVRVRGLMTVLPETDDEQTLKEKCLQTRKLYDIIKKGDENITVLSMGMSADYALAIENGSNMVRIGTRIFGKRNYGEEK